MTRIACRYCFTAQQPLCYYCFSVGLVFLCIDEASVYSNDCNRFVLAFILLVPL